MLLALSSRAEAPAGKRLRSLARQLPAALASRVASRPKLVWQVVTTVGKEDAIARVVS